MTKQSPRRNQRSTGFRLVHGIQVLLWLATCIWLLYQFKHFYDNKKVYVQSLAKTSEDGVLQLGRKHIHIGRHDKVGTQMSKPKESEEEALRKGGGYPESEENADDDEEEQEQVSEEVEDLIDEEDRETEEQDTD